MCLEIDGLSYKSIHFDYKSSKHQSFLVTFFKSTFCSGATAATTKQKTYWWGFRNPAKQLRLVIYPMIWTVLVKINRQWTTNWAKYLGRSWECDPNIPQITPQIDSTWVFTQWFLNYPPHFLEKIYTSPEKVTNRPRKDLFFPSKMVPFQGTFVHVATPLIEYFPPLIVPQ